MSQGKGPPRGRPLPLVPLSCQGSRAGRVADPHPGSLWEAPFILRAAVVHRWHVGASVWLPFRELIMTQLSLSKDVPYRRET